VTSRQENARYLKDSSNILQTRPQTFSVPSSAKSSSNFGLSVSENTPRAPKRIQDEPRRAPAVTRPPRVKTTQAPKTTTRFQVTTRAPVTTTRAPVLRAPSTPFPDRIQSIEPLFVSATENDENNFIDDVFEAEMAKMQENGWVLPPSLMAVAAVPGAPVINQQVEAQRVPKGIPDAEVLREMDPYLQFMPVPAVPGSQAPRQPKDSLNSFDINLNLANTVETATSAPTLRRPAPRPLASTSAPRNVAPTRAPSSQDDKRESRKQFKRCQGRCVQQFCLPVESISVYEGCVDKCKAFCT